MHVFKMRIRYLHNALLKLCRYNSTIAKEAAEAKLYDSNVEFTDRLQFVDPDEKEKVPIYRAMNRNGEILDLSTNRNFDPELVINMYKCMITTSILDKILYESQRQGRISFYMVSSGEEGTQIGSSAALNKDDLIYAQYREVGALLWRGFPIEQTMNQCYGNVEDWGKGKQMPIHYGSRVHNFVTLSSPLATQMPQATGSAYGFKLSRSDRCVLVYFGDGAASEADAHTSFNFAATLQCPVIFLCRNNGYAISTPVSQQYKSDGIVGRAIGFGITAIRVDGNDTLAVYNATTAARKYVLENNRPVVIEAFTYRCGDHSTSDDSSRYRSVDDVMNWQKYDNPITKLRLYMEKNSWWNESVENNFKASLKKQILAAFARAEKRKKPEWQEMFNDVYYEMPDNLMEQSKYLENHLKQYGQHYPLKDFTSKS